jgi:hypothetical protein
VALLLAALSTLGGCGGFTDLPFEQTSEISACGGFPQALSLVFADPPAYCDAEVLYWEYAAATQTLTLTDSRVILNCCGEHGMTVDWRDGHYLLTETDAPQNLGRCSCMCVYDYRVTVQGIPQAPFEFELWRRISDSPETSGRKFTGTLDLSQPSGFVIIDASSADPWCTQ